MAAQRYDSNFGDLATRLRARVTGDVEAELLVDEMQREFGELLTHAALLACQNRVAGLPDVQRPVLEVVA